MPHQNYQSVLDTAVHCDHECKHYVEEYRKIASVASVA